ncbi:MAG: ArsR family transcriptional regulator [Candidatus Hodarchaeales archaeon]|jgi:predicted transcriptional regulator
MTEQFDSVSSLFSNATRLQIMHCLWGEPLTITELTAKIPNASASGISRHLSVLDASNLIVKKAATGRTYELSSFGESLCCMLKPIVFFLKFNPYFQSHSLASLPGIFLRNINVVLEHARFVEGTGSVMATIREFVKSAKRHLYYTADTHLIVTPSCCKDIRVIYPVTLVEEIGAQKLREDVNEYSILSPEEVSLRLLPEINIGIAIADEFEKGLMAFPRNDGSAIDYSGMFVIEDETGMEQLKHMWRYYWDAAQPVSLEL